MLRPLTLWLILATALAGGIAPATVNAEEEVTRLPRLQVNARTPLKLGFTLVWNFNRVDNARVTVMSVKSRSVAAKAGLQEGDYLVAINGQSIAKLSMDEVTRRLTVEPGEALNLGVIRQSKSLQITLDTGPSRKRSEPR